VPGITRLTEQQEVELVFTRANTPAKRNVSASKIEAIFVGDHRWYIYVGIVIVKQILLTRSKKIKLSCSQAVAQSQWMVDHNSEVCGIA